MSRVISEDQWEAYCRLLETELQEYRRVVARFTLSMSVSDITRFEADLQAHQERLDALKASPILREVGLAKTGRLEVVGDPDRPVSGLYVVLPGVTA